MLEVSEALAEGQMVEQLDKAKEVAALAAAVTAKQIFADRVLEMAMSKALRMAS